MHSRCQGDVASHNLKIPRDLLLVSNPSMADGKFRLVGGRRACGS